MERICGNELVMTQKTEGGCYEMLPFSSDAGKMLVNARLEEGTEGRELHYDLRGMITLGALLDEKCDGEMILSVLRELADCAKSCAEYLIDEESILWSFDTLYFHPAQKRMKLIYVPDSFMEEGEKKRTSKEFAEELSGRLLERYVREKWENETGGIVLLRLAQELETLKQKGMEIDLGVLEMNVRATLQQRCVSYGGAEEYSKMEFSESTGDYLPREVKEEGEKAFLDGLVERKNSGNGRKNGPFGGRKRKNFKE